MLYFINKSNIAVGEQKIRRISYYNFGTTELFSTILELHGGWEVHKLLQKPGELSFLSCLLMVALDDFSGLEISNGSRDIS